MSAPSVGGPAGSSGRASLALMAIGLLVGLVAGLVVFVGLPGWPPGVAPAAGGTPGTPAPAPVTGAPAPDFSLLNLEGEMVSLSDLKGRVVLINFWATWCGPCRLEMPHIEQKHQALESQGLTVLAVNVDDTAEDAGAFADELGLTFPILLDSSDAVNQLYRVRGFPTTFIVDRYGMIKRQHIGFMSEGQLDDYLAGLGLID